MKNHEPSSNTLKHVGKKPGALPYSEQMQKTADKIANNATTAMNDGKMDGVEGAGHISMATLLSSISNGDVPLAKAYPLLKGFADKKTPDPVQKVETRTEIDMRTILFDAVAKNPTALEDVVAISLAAREQIRINIKADDNKLELKPLPEATSPTDQTQDTDLQPLPDHQPLDEFAYDLRKTEFTELLQQGKSDKLEQMLDDEAKGVIASDNKPNDKDWAPGSEPSEITQLRDKKERGDESKRNSKT